MIVTPGFETESLLATLRPTFFVPQPRENDVIGSSSTTTAKEDESQNGNDNDNDNDNDNGGVLFGSSQFISIYCINLEKLTMQAYETARANRAIASTTIPTTSTTSTCSTSMGVGQTEEDEYIVQAIKSSSSSEVDPVSIITTLVSTLLAVEVWRTHVLFNSTITTEDADHHNNNNNNDNDDNNVGNDDCNDKHDNVVNKRISSLEEKNVMDDSLAVGEDDDDKVIVTNDNQYTVRTAATSAAAVAESKSNNVTNEGKQHNNQPISYRCTPVMLLERYLLRILCEINNTPS